MKVTKEEIAVFEQCAAKALREYVKHSLTFSRIKEVDDFLIIHKTLTVFEKAAEYYEKLGQIKKDAFDV